MSKKEVTAVDYNNLGKIEYYLGDYAGAIKEFTKVIKLHPDSAIAYYNRGLAKQRLGDLDGAIADYDKAIKLNPEYCEALHTRRNAIKSKEKENG